MILSCGEALIDMLPRETEAGEAAFAPYAGGAVFNTAIALGRLGAPSAFFSGLSSDLFGDILRASLEESKVDSTPAHISDRPTTLAFVTLKGGQASYAFYDENTAGRMLSEENLPDISPEAAFFGGISLVVEPCGTAYETLQAWQAERTVTMIDPNIRTSFISEETSYRQRIERMMARADIVKLSDEDLHWLRGEGDIDTLAHEVLETGPSLVLITRGSEGATGYTARDEIKVAANPVKVADTVGAGDTFNAGVLASLHAAGVLRKDILPTLGVDVIGEAISLGVRAAAVTVSRAGANPPWADEL
jgi:fructokinase